MAAAAAAAALMPRCASGRHFVHSGGIRPGAHVPSQTELRRLSLTSGRQSPAQSSLRWIYRPAARQPHESSH